MAKPCLIQNPSGAYVYEIIVDGVARYVGKGTGKRMYKHLKVARRIAARRAAGETFWARTLYNRLAKAISRGSDIREHLLADGLNDAQAFDLETSRMSTYPEDQLWNTRNGGPGNSREYSLALWRNEGYRAKQAAWRAKNAQRVRESAQVARTLRWSDPQERLKQSDRGREEFRHLKEFWDANPEMRSIHQNDRLQNPEYVERVKAGHKARWEREESRGVMSAAMTYVWSDIDRRERMSQKLREKWRDPEFKRQQLENRRAKCSR